LTYVSSEFEQRTMQAFRRLALEGAPPEQVAAELNMSVGAVYVAKSRVVRRLRTEAEGLIAQDRLA
jgi:RNA polymerase sigma-70 factor (ECF subfamily)